MANEFISIGDSLYKIELISSIELKANSIIIMCEKGTLGEVKFESDQAAKDELKRLIHILGK